MRGMMNAGLWTQQSERHSVLSTILDAKHGPWPAIANHANNQILGGTVWSGEQY